MSIDGVIGRIDQILQLQQQILDPAATTSAAQPTSSATSTASSVPTSTSGTSSTFASALAEAEASATTTSAESSALDALAPSGTDGDGGDDSMTADPSSSTPDLSSSSLLLTALQEADAATPTAATTPLTDVATGTAATTTTATSGPDGGMATSVDDPRVQAMVQEANSLVGDPYVWGGGHSGWGPQSGYDCSGFVSAVLHAGGYLSTPQDTETLPTAAGIESGPGQYVTIYDRNEAGQEGHVIIDIAGQFYESGGQAGSWGGGGGVEKIGTPSAAYLATFNDILHPAGL